MLDYVRVINFLLLLIVIIIISREEVVDIAMNRLKWRKAAAVL